MTAKVHIYDRSCTGKAWRCVARNGRIMGSGWGFNNLRNVRESVDLVSEIFTDIDTAKIRVYEKVTGEWAWTLRANNNEILASGWGLNSKPGAWRSVRRLAELMQPGKYTIEVME